MEVLLTNGKFYIALTETGGVVKVEDREQAHVFKTGFQAQKLKLRATKKCAGYYCVNKDGMETGSGEKTGTAARRKSFSHQERAAIYRKTKGHCYLCGEFVDYADFEIEHKVPLSKGGSNDFDNLFCSCHCCNTIKRDIYPQDFMEKVSQIFLFQMEQKSRKSLKWRLAYRGLRRMTESVMI